MSIGVKLIDALTNIGVGQLKQRGGNKKGTSDIVESMVEDVGSAVGSAIEAVEGDTVLGEISGTNNKKKVGKAALHGIVKLLLFGALFIILSIIYVYSDPSQKKYITLLLGIDALIFIGYLIPLAKFFKFIRGRPIILLVVVSTIILIIIGIGVFAGITIGTTIKLIPTKMITGLILFFIVYKISKNFKIVIIDDNILSRLVFYVTLLYIFHALWVILTFTNPTGNICKIKVEDTCSAKWVYNGAPFNLDENIADYTKYIFDIFTWFPPEHKKDSNDKCQLCPTLYTPTNYSCKTVDGVTSESGNISCRPCDRNESWYSIKELLVMQDNGSLTPAQITAIGDNGYITKDSTGNIINSISNKSSKLISDNPNIFDEPMDDIGGICIPDETTTGIYHILSPPPSNCNNYIECMNNNPTNMLEISWPTIDNHFLPNQHIQIRDTTNPIDFYIPDTLYSSTGNDIYKDNKYGNFICENTITSEGKCSLRMPLYNTITKDLLTTVPSNLQKKRIGCEGVYCNNIEPCHSVNEIIYDWNQLNNNRQIDLHNDDLLYNDTNEDWISMLHSVRKSCLGIDGGKCYVNDNYICKTSKGTTIPIADKGKIVIPNPKLPQNGCNQPLMVDTCVPSSTEEQSCTTFKVNNGYLVDTPGKCINVKYENNVWKRGDDINKDVRCVPTSKLEDLRNNLDTTIDGATLAEWVNTPTFEFPYMCSRVGKTNIEWSVIGLPTSIDADTVSDDSVIIPNQIQNQISDLISGGSSSVSSDSYELCSSMTNPCPTGKSLIPGKQYSIDDIDAINTCCLSDQSIIDWFNDTIGSYTLSIPKIYNEAIPSQYKDEYQSSMDTQLDDDLVLGDYIEGFKGSFITKNYQTLPSPSQINTIIDRVNDLTISTPSNYASIVLDSSQTNFGIPSDMDTISLHLTNAESNECSNIGDICTIHNRIGKCMEINYNNISGLYACIPDIIEHVEPSFYTYLNEAWTQSSHINESLEYASPSLSSSWSIGPDNINISLCGPYCEDVDSTDCIIDSETDITTFCTPEYKMNSCCICNRGLWNSDLLYRGELFPSPTITIPTYFNIKTDISTVISESVDDRSNKLVFKKIKKGHKIPDNSQYGCYHPRNVDNSNRVTDELKFDIPQFRTYLLEEGHPDHPIRNIPNPDVNNFELIDHYYKQCLYGSIQSGSNPSSCPTVCPTDMVIDTNNIPFCKRCPHGQGRPYTANACSPCPSQIKSTYGCYY